MSDGLTLEEKNVRTLKLIVALCNAQDAGISEDWWTDLAVTAADALDVLEAKNHTESSA